MGIDLDRGDRRAAPNTPDDRRREWSDRNIRNVPIHAIALIAWALLIVASFGWGHLLQTSGALQIDHFAPLFGYPRLQTWRMLPTLAVGGLFLAGVPPLARRLGWRPTLAFGWLASLAWTVSVAVSDGFRHLTAAFSPPRGDYLPVVRVIGDHPLSWLRHFTRNLPHYSTHVRGHPPLPDLILWTLDRAGLAGPGWASALTIGAGTSATVAVAITVRLLAGEDAARRALPFLVLGPWVIWIATSMDALYLGVSAWGTAAAAVAATRLRRPMAVTPMAVTPVAVAPMAVAPVAVAPVAVAGMAVAPTAVAGCSTRGLPSPRADIGAWFPVRGTRRSGRSAVAAGVGVAVVAGILLGAVLYLNYGLVPFLAVPLAVVVIVQPRPVALVGMVAGGVLVVAAFTLAGFWWPDGVRATHAAWAADPGSHRPQVYFLIGNLAVAALATSPATAAALPAAFRGVQSAVFRSRGPRHLVRGCRTAPLAALVAAALVAVVAVDVSGFTRGEVQRIWLPYFPWIAAATAALPRVSARRWLAAHGAVGVVIQAVLRTIW